jgi:excisionase family DNA binding protein
MLTVPQAARRIGRNPETVRRWIREGKLVAHKVGTQHVIDEEALAAFEARSDQAAVPDSWLRTITGEAMPDVVAAIRRSRDSH